MFLSGWKSQSGIRWSPPFPCCPVSCQCPWKKTLIEKKKKKKKSSANFKKLPDRGLIDLFKFFYACLLLKNISYIWLKNLVFQFIQCTKVILRTGVFRTLSNIKDGAICKNSQLLLSVYYFGKRIHLICFTGFWICSEYVLKST